METKKQKLKAKKTDKLVILESVRFTQITEGIKVNVRDFEANREEGLMFGSLDRFYEEFEVLDDMITSKS